MKYRNITICILNENDKIENLANDIQFMKCDIVFKKPKKRNLNYDIVKCRFPLKRKGM